MVKPFGVIAQQGHVVEDIDEAVNCWHQSLGVGPVRAQPH